MSITIHNVFDEERVDRDWYKPITFPAGEPHVQLDPAQFKDEWVWVDARITSAGEFMELCVLLDALYGIGTKFTGLFLPYFPSSRQDRRTAPGSPSTLEVYGHALAGRSHCVVTLDLHGRRPPHLLLHSVPLGAIPWEGLTPSNYSGIIQPDAGARDRAVGLAQTMPGIPLFKAAKVRAPSTGKLSGFQCEPLKPGRYLVVDDICDGGGTFIGLAEEIKRNNPGVYLDLLVTHGIFSRGLADLFARFGHIFTTDSFPQPWAGNCPNLHVTPVHSIGARLMRERITR